MGFIENFYYGNLEPQMREIKKDSGYQKDFHKLCEIETVLKEKLADAERNLFIEYVNLWGIISGDIDFDSYKAGFKHGAAFTLDAFNTNN